MQIVPYEEQYRQDFIRLNTEWLEKYFVVEKEDNALFNSIDELLAKGTMFYFAVEDGEAIAAGMMQPMGNDEWELCKLGATEKHQGKGAGKGVFLACMQYAIDHGAKKVVIVSNRILTRAINMYLHYGFVEVPLEPEYAIFDRADIQLEYVVPTVK